MNQITPAGEHYQIEWQQDGYHVQRINMATSTLRTQPYPHCCYGDALVAAAQQATPECPLLAWGYAITDTADARIARAVKLESEYAAALAVGRRYEETGNPAVFTHFSYR